MVSYDLGAGEQGKCCLSGCECMNQAPFSVLRACAVEANRQIATKAPDLFKATQFKPFVK